MLRMGPFLSLWERKIQVRNYDPWYYTSRKLSRDWQAASSPLRLTA
jgi:hypothetical protein